MSTKFKDIAHLYLGCQMVLISNGNFLYTYKLLPEHFPSNWDTVDFLKDSKPILRPISDISESDAENLALILFNDPEITNDRISQEEIQVNIIKDGHVWDKALYPKRVMCVIDVTIRCWDGSIIVLSDGSILRFDENELPEHIYNLSNATKFLLSKSFDLFGLIESGEAIDVADELLNQLEK